MIQQVLELVIESWDRQEDDLMWEPFLQVHPLMESEDPVPILARSLLSSEQNDTFPCAIIYALKRESVDDIARRLQASGVAFNIHRLS